MHEGSKMNIKQLKQGLSQRGFSTQGLKLVERLEQAMQQAKDKKMNEAFHSIYARLAEKEEEVAELEARLATAVRARGRQDGAGIVPEQRAFRHRGWFTR
jgi:uncharacterized protein YecT (DUF1311 family)